MAAFLVIQVNIRTYFRKKNKLWYAPISGITQSKDLPLLGVTFQGDQITSKFSSYAKINLTIANKCLYVLRTLCKEQYNQDEINHMFKAIILPTLLYCSRVYSARLRS